MWTFDRLTNFFFYLKDSISLPKTHIKIDEISFNTQTNQFNVLYRLGRQKLLHKVGIKKFSQDYFEAISNYDRHRLTKFLALQAVFDDLFKTDFCQKNDFICYLKEEGKHDSIF